MSEQRETAGAGPMRETGAELPPGALRAFTVLCPLLALLRVFPWLFSELWYDEVVTLTDFVGVWGQGMSLSHVFRHYPVANNHILFSALGWFWVRFLDFPTGEHLLRGLPVLFGMGSVLIMVRCWRRWLGLRGAAIAAGMTAVSPVVAGFIWQFRGYGLSLFLATALMTGTAELAEHRWRSGLLWSVPSALLLPLVIPTNVLLPAALVLFLLVRPIQTGRPDVRWKTALAVAAPAAVGCAYYLTIWDQFMRVLGQTAGWDSGSAVAGGLLLAGLAHVGIFAWPVCSGIHRLLRDRRDAVPVQHRLAEPARLLACCIVPVGIALLFLRPAPYPRVFLILSPAVTFAVVMLARTSVLWRRWRVSALFAVLLVSGYTCERAATALAAARVAEGRYPQNLLQQYYRGDSGNRELCVRLREQPVPETVIVFCSAFDHATLRYYWVMSGAPPDQVVPENLIPPNPVQRWGPAYARRAVVAARNDIEAARIAQAAGLRGPLQREMACGDRCLYGVVP